MLTSFFLELLGCLWGNQLKFFLYTRYFVEEANLAYSKKSFQVFLIHWFNDDVQSGRKVEVPTPAHKILGLPQKSKKAIVYVPPNAASKELSSWENEQVDTFLESGFAVVVFNYAGYGYNDGMVPSVRDSVQRLVRIYDWLHDDKGFEQIGFYGQSLGGLVASMASLERNVSFLALDRTFSTLRRVVEGIFSYSISNLFRCFFVEAECSSVQPFLKSKATKVLFFDPTDTIIPLYGSLYFEWLEIRFQEIFGKLEEDPNTFKVFKRAFKMVQEIVCQSETQEEATLSLSLFSEDKPLSPSDQESLPLNESTQLLDLSESFAGKGLSGTPSTSTPTNIFRKMSHEERLLLCLKSIREAPRNSVKEQVQSICEQFELFSPFSVYGLSPKKLFEFFHEWQQPHIFWNMVKSHLVFDDSEGSLVADHAHTLAVFSQKCGSVCSSLERVCEMNSDWWIEALRSDIQELKRGLDHIVEVAGKKEKQKRMKGNEMKVAVVPLACGHNGTIKGLEKEMLENILMGL